MGTDAFRQLAIAELDAVHRMALHLVRNPDEAADLVQETYLRAFRGEHTFVMGERGIRPWLFKVLHNAFYTRYEKQKRQPVASDTLGETAVGDPGDGNGEPAWNLASLDWEQVDDRLKRAIEELPANYRSPLLLWGVEGLKYREIAEVMDVPIGTVMSRLHRARSILMEKLADLAAEQGLTQGKKPH